MPVVAYERLGGLYEERGEPEKAAAAYSRLIAAWEDADEELQPRVEAALPDDIGEPETAHPPSGGSVVET